VSSTAALRGTLQSFPGVHYPDNSFVASPHQLHFLPFDFCTQVGVNPFTTSSRPISSPASLANTSHLGASRFSTVDKGKSPLHLVSSDSSLTNISHPCPITISPPLTHPAHFTDFLAKWPQPLSPRPILHPSSSLDFSASPLYQSSSSPSLSPSLPSIEGQVRFPLFPLPGQPLKSFTLPTTQQLDPGFFTSIKPLFPSSHIGFSSPLQLPSVSWVHVKC
jgi:hypothetical protein